MNKDIRYRLNRIVETNESGKIKRIRYRFVLIYLEKDGVPQMWVANYRMLFHPKFRIKCYEKDSCKTIS